MQKLTLNSDIIRQRAIEMIRYAPAGSLVTIREGEARSLDANAKMWPMLHDVATQIDYHGSKLTEEDWKDIFSSSLAGELRMVPTLDNQRIVLLGLRTSKMSKRRFSELIELIYSYGSQRGVVWSEPACAEDLHSEAQRYLGRAA